MHLARPLSLPLIALSLSLLGCEKQACFQWTEVEGTCPAPDDALAFFQNPDCVNAVRSVDSDAEFDGELCCYDVTAYDTGDEVCAGGSAGSGSFPGIPKPVPQPGTPPFEDGGSGSGGGSVGTSPSCARCFELVFGTPSAPACPGSLELADQLLGCECAGACGSVCCGEGLQTAACEECRARTPSDCEAELTACLKAG